MSDAIDTDALEARKALHSTRRDAYRKVLMALVDITGSIRMPRYTRIEDVIEESKFVRTHYSDLSEVRGIVCRRMANKLDEDMVKLCALRDALREWADVE